MLASAVVNTVMSQMCALTKQLSCDNCTETNLAGKLMSVFVFPWVVTICSLQLSSTLCDVTSVYINWASHRFKLLDTIHVY